MAPSGVDFTRRDSVELHLLNNDPHEDDLYRMDDEDLAELRKIPGNDQCIDCGKEDPQWASLNLAIFMCLECSGQHRALGTHVSFVRSVKMDSWSDVQLEKMRIGGNQQCVEFLKGHGVSIRCADSQEEERKANNSLVSIRERYDCATAMLYQQVLKARQENRPEPTELPEYTSAADRLAKLKIMQGFGSSHNLEASPALRPKKLEALERGVSHLWNSLTDKLEVSLEPKDPSSPPDKNTPFKGAPPLETLERSVSSIWNNLTDNISKLKQ